ncbi:MAG: L-aspartate oxidase [Candidatus Wallbacteria bacterium]|nr:L-aspartate oxidase [Candidatus Wallbacteria bacterium]
MKKLFNAHLSFPKPVKTIPADIVIIGSGLAGLMAAVACAESGLNPVILTREKKLSSSSSLAQGGIACVWDDPDSLQDHYQDTLKAGYYYNNREAVKILVEEGQQVVTSLVRLGMKFDDKNRIIELGQEGAHSFRRILHAGGDATGWNLVQFLMGMVHNQGRTRIVEEAFVYDLAIEDCECRGVFSTSEEGPVFWNSKAVIVASGGFGQIYRYTTQAETNYGEILAETFLHGATISDMEFVQFHPTAFVGEDGTTFLITEALRGEGAYLLNEKGERFMNGVHELMELAPRDIVSRAIVAQKKAFIDARHLPGKFLTERFPTIFNNCLRKGYDLRTQLLPIRPVAHYTIGGLKTDLCGGSDIAGLYACGEAANVGCHGANRLASNSLLEALVFGRRAGFAAGKFSRHGHLSDRIGSTGRGRKFSCRDSEKFRNLMTEITGVIREGTKLQELVDGIERKLGEFSETGVSFGGLPGYYRLINSYLVAKSALLRAESRGVHFRKDFPQTDPRWSKRMNFNIEKGITYEKVDCGPESGRSSDR